ncbi:hypothetical protein BSL78_17003 [Apostichopus japonicus]|uniref:DUF7818 domain-containing protein n=1 Tax=Stichopus japonicus TaxID=307972 RepID=A0A2G8KDT1_STIJA|nr:hypothetical protein BSL78_17003 [Apostichopus japonicus]
MAVALQLQEIFGSVGYNIDSDVLSEDDLTISVDLPLAKAIHFAWRQNFQQKFEREEKTAAGDDEARCINGDLRDEELAKQLQQEEEQMRMKAVQKQLEKEHLRKNQQASSRADLASPSMSSSRSPGVRTETFRISWMTIWPKN